VLPTSRRGRLVLAGIAGSLLLLLGSAGVAALRANAAWATFCEQTREIERDVAARPHHRDALWGEHCGESAFAHYETAGKEARALEQEIELEKFCPKPDAELVTAPVRPRWQTIAAALHRGAHATDTTPLPASTLTDTTFGHFNMLWLRWIAYAAAHECRALLHEGRQLDAVELSLDSATLALDVARRGDAINQMIGGATLGIALGPWNDERLARLPVAALDEIAKGLERLDRAWPAIWDADSELLTAARGVQSVIGDGGGGPWHYGFSARWMFADAFPGYAKVLRGLAMVEPSWPRRAALLEVAFAEEQARGNVLADHYADVQISIEHGARRVCAGLRLLRMAVDLHRGGDMPPLTDPLGDCPIARTRTAGGTRLCCANDLLDHAVERLVRR